MTWHEQVDPIRTAVIWRISEEQIVCGGTSWWREASNWQQSTPRTLIGSLWRSGSPGRNIQGGIPTPESNIPGKISEVICDYRSVMVKPNWSGINQLEMTLYLKGNVLHHKASSTVAKYFDNLFLELPERQPWANAMFAQSPPPSATPWLSGRWTLSLSRGWNLGVFTFVGVYMININQFVLKDEQSYWQIICNVFAYEIF